MIHVGFLLIIYVQYVSDPQKSQKNPVSLEALRSITPLASLGLLHIVG